MFTYLALHISYAYTVFYTILRNLSHLIMFTYLALLISYAYTVFYTILLYLSPLRSDITCPCVYSLNSFLHRCVCIVYMLWNLFDITALSELEAEAFDLIWVSVVQVSQWNSGESEQYRSACSTWVCVVQVSQCSSGDSEQYRSQCMSVVWSEGLLVRQITAVTSLGFY